MKEAAKILFRSLEISADADLSLLKQPVKLGTHTISNRFLFQPMEGCDGTPDGSPGELTRRRYERFARSGAGVLWVEAVAVCPEGRANPRQLWLHEENKEAFRKLVESIRQTAREEGLDEPLILMQATHSGRQSRPVEEPRPRIAIHNGYFEKEKALPDSCIVSDEECERIIRCFRMSTRLAMECGFDGIDVKCCHGYLFNEFMSAYQRPGPYGGTLENRTRLFFDCIRAARDAAGDAAADGRFLLTTRFNAYDGFPYPWGFGTKEGCGTQPELTQAKWVMERLTKEFGMQMVNVSIGNPYVNPHVNRPYTGCETESPYDGIRRIAQITGELQHAFPETAVVLSGLSFLKEDALAYAAGMLAAGKASFAGFGRETIAYPEFVRDFLRDEGIPAKRCCVACGKCTQIMRAGGTAGCPVFDREVYGPIYETFVRQHRS